MTIKIEKERKCNKTETQKIQKRAFTYEVLA
jgi:hypothetical protein